MTLIVGMVGGQAGDAILITDCLAWPSDPALAPHTDVVKSIRINDALAVGACGDALYANAILARLVGWRIDEATDRYRVLNDIETTGHGRPGLTYREAKRLIKRHMPILTEVSQLDDVESTQIFLASQGQACSKLCVWQPSAGDRPRELKGSPRPPQAIVRYPIAELTDEVDTSIETWVLDEHRDLTQRIKALLRHCHEASRGGISRRAHMRRGRHGFRLETVVVD
ncbi:MAG: hypothetical protein ABEK03_07090 [Candidatus Bipolaricaulia bacterium]